jgi:DNA-binding transcriptional ArsR family regulator
MFDFTDILGMISDMEILGKLLGTEERVKIMRLFLLNAEMCFDVGDIMERSKVSRGAFRREIAVLLKIGFVKPKMFTKEIEKKKGNGVKMFKKKVSGWQLSIDFPLLLPVRNLLISSEPVKKEEIIERFKNTGKVKLLVLAGVFIQKEDSRVDILIVGDDLKKKSVENSLRCIEAEVGKELSYALFDTQDFIYRLNVYDKFVRDILDFPHEKILDKMVTPQ